MLDINVLLKKQVTPNQESAAKIQEVYKGGGINFCVRGWRATGLARKIFRPIPES